MRHQSGEHWIHEPDWLAVGETTAPHVHEFGHTTIVLRGSAEIDIGGAVEVVNASDLIPWRWVPAQVRHSVRRMDDARIICLFSREEGMYTAWQA
jgi:quercetin dioxygenase-like cupin family protein